MKHQIGKVIEVKGDTIAVALIDFDGENDVGVPEEMAVDVATPRRSSEYLNRPTWLICRIVFAQRHFALLGNRNSDERGQYWSD